MVICHCVKYTSLCSQGVIDLVLDCIDRLHQHSSHFSEAAQSDTEEEWKIILDCFYDLLGETCIIYHHLHTDFLCATLKPQHHFPLTRLPEFCIFI